MHVIYVYLHIHTLQCRPILSPVPEYSVSLSLAPCSGLNLLYKGIVFKSKILFENTETCILKVRGSIYCSHTKMTQNNVILILKFQGKLYKISKHRKTRLFK